MWDTGNVNTGKENDRTGNFSGRGYREQFRFVEAGPRRKLPPLYRDAEEVRYCGRWPQAEAVASGHRVQKS